MPLNILLSRPPRGLGFSTVCPATHRSGAALASPREGTETGFDGPIKPRYYAANTDDPEQQPTETLQNATYKHKPYKYIITTSQIIHYKYKPYSAAAAGVLQARHLHLEHGRPGAALDRNPAACNGAALKRNPTEWNLNSCTNPKPYFAAAAGVL